MKYMFFVYGETNALEVPRDAPCLTFGKYASEQPNYVLTRALHPPRASSVVSVRDGATVVTDGPFIETKEYLGGFYIMEFTDREAALEFAARIPGASDGHIEVRPVVEFE